MTSDSLAESTSHVSPFAPPGFPELPAVNGVRLGVAASGMRYRGRDDLLLAAFADGTTVAGVFTRSQTAAAPVLWCREVLARRRGAGARRQCRQRQCLHRPAGRDRPCGRRSTASAALFGCPPQQVFVASTGVIGEALPRGPAAAGAAAGRRARWGPTAGRRRRRPSRPPTPSPRARRAACEIDGRTVTHRRHRQGIRHDRARHGDHARLRVHRCGDRRTRCCRCCSTTRSTGRSTASPSTATPRPTTRCCCSPPAPPASRRSTIAADRRPRSPSAQALDRVCRDLAQQVVEDGEGHTKFVTIARQRRRRRRRGRARIALTIANSPLVKTAIAGADANWGRIVMAVGKAGERIDRDRLAIRIGGVLITADGGPLAAYDEAPVAAHMQGRRDRHRGRRRHRHR